jgi:hypothetical protein
MLIASLRNRVRVIFNIRQKRKPPRRTGKPAIGTFVAREDLRITTLAGMSDELWRWLLDQGWREIRFQNDRRRYRDIPAVWVTRLIDATPDMYPRILNAAVARAAQRPSLRVISGPGAAPKGRPARPGASARK